MHIMLFVSSGKQVCHINIPQLYMSSNVFNGNHSHSHSHDVSVNSSFDLVLEFERLHWSCRV